MQNKLCARQNHGWTVLLLLIGSKCCLLIQPLCRFYSDSMTSVKSSSRWVIGVLAWTWTTCRRKVVLMVHFVASIPKVLYCWFMAVNCSGVVHFPHFSRELSHWQNNLYLGSTNLFWWFSMYNMELKHLHFKNNSANFLCWWRSYDVCMLKSSNKLLNRPWMDIVFKMVVSKLYQAQF